MLTRLNDHYFQSQKRIKKLKEKKIDEIYAQFSELSKLCYEEQNKSTEDVMKNFCENLSKMPANCGEVCGFQNLDDLMTELNEFTADSLRQYTDNRCMDKQPCYTPCPDDTRQTDDCMNLLYSNNSPCVTSPKRLKTLCSPLYDPSDENKPNFPPKKNGCCQTVLLDDLDERKHVNDFKTQNWKSTPQNVDEYAKEFDEQTPNKRYDTQTISSIKSRTGKRSKISRKVVKAKSVLTTNKKLGETKSNIRFKSQIFNNDHLKKKPSRIEPVTEDSWNFENICSKIEKTRVCLSCNMECCNKCMETPCKQFRNTVKTLKKTDPCVKKPDNQINFDSTLSSINCVHQIETKHCLKKKPRNTIEDSNAATDTLRKNCPSDILKFLPDIKTQNSPQYSRKSKEKSAENKTEPNSKSGESQDNGNFRNISPNRTLNNRRGRSLNKKNIHKTLFGRQDYDNQNLPKNNARIEESNINTQINNIKTGRSKEDMSSEIDDTLTNDSETKSVSKAGKNSNQLISSNINSSAIPYTLSLNNNSKKYLSSDSKVMNSIADTLNEVDKKLERKNLKTKNQKKLRYYNRKMGLRRIPKKRLKNRRRIRKKLKPEYQTSAHTEPAKLIGNKDLNRNSIQETVDLSNDVKYSYQENLDSGKNPVISVYSDTIPSMISPLHSSVKSSDVKFIETHLSKLSIKKNSVDEQNSNDQKITSDEELCKLLKDNYIDHLTYPETLEMFNRQKYHSHNPNNELQERTLTDRYNKELTKEMMDSHSTKTSVLVHYNIHSSGFIDQNNTKIKNDPEVNDNSRNGSFFGN
ncbi:hypothetical protein SNEBB_009219 [Seison nebaliae]|nr:hypothetical protein SNEBB_009219 [Seison nebaliae]